MCEKLAVLGFISGGEESQVPYKDILKTTFKMGWPLVSVSGSGALHVSA